MFPDDWFCERASNTYDGISCPDGHYKVSEESFRTHCDDKGLPCPEGMTCYCRPCIKAYEVDVFQWDFGDLGEVGDEHDRCDKMSLCGTVEQNGVITLLAHDNLERENATVTALVHLTSQSMYLPVVYNGGDQYEYEFTFSHSKRGVAILEVFVDDVQIPESPFRIQVIERECFGRQVAVSCDFTFLSFP